MDDATLKMCGFVKWDSKGNKRIQKKAIKQYLGRKPVSEWKFMEFYLNALLAA